MILLLFISIVFSQTQVINSWQDWSFSGNSKPIPTIAANLKPERQPSWTDPGFINLVDSLKIPSLRWPGAVGSNYFDWHKGTILPCYKFNHSIGSCFNDIYCKDALASEIPGGCIAKELQIELLNSDANADENISVADNINDNSNYGINYDAFESYGFDPIDITPVSDSDWNLLQDYDVLIPDSNSSSDINNFPILISDNGSFPKGRNKNSNFAQDYFNAMDSHSDFKPFFVLNVYNPEYIDAEEAFGLGGGWDTNADCTYNASENNGNSPNIYNSIVEQLDKICELNIKSEFYIQLGNEVWHLFEYDENTFPCARAYAERMIEIAQIIDGSHDLSNPDWGTCFSDAKIALFADAHAPGLQGDDYCEGISIPGDYDPNEWNDFSGTTLEDMSSYTDEDSCLSNGGSWNNSVCYKTWSCNVDWNPENTNYIPNSDVSKEKRCEWNETISRVLQNYNDATDLFDAVSIHKYYGAANMSVPCFGDWSYWNEENNETDSQWITVDVETLDLGECEASGYDGWNDAHEIRLNDDLPWGWAFDLYTTNQNLRDSNSPTLTDYYKLDYMVKWLTVNVDISLDYWDGTSDSPTALDGLYDNLIPENTNYEIWITEYDTEPSDKQWVGTWPHALSFLYRTLRYIEDVPNVTLLSPNNLYGFWGPYQLLDSYSIDNAGNDGISCYVSHDFSTSCVREYCDNIFVNLSPKGEVLKIFNELVHDRGNTTLEKMIIDTTKVPEVYIERASVLTDLDEETQITFKTQDVHGWRFNPRDDYIFMNLSPRLYTLDFGVTYADGACYYGTKTVSSENLFAKNYYNPNPSVNLNHLDDVAEQGIDTSRANEYVLWEFDGSAPLDLNPYYAATSSLTKLSGSTDSQMEILLPPYSVVQVFSSCEQGAFYPGDVNIDGIINVLDIIEIINSIINDTEFTDIQFELADLNNDSSVDVVDIMGIVNIITAEN